MKRTKRKRRQRGGSVLALFPGLLVVMCVMGAFSVDLGYVFVADSQLRTAAEAASLAGAIKLRDGDFGSDINASAITFAQLNEPENGNVLMDADITLGSWDYDTQTFSPSSVDPNAVQTVVRRDGANTSSVPLFFAKIFGMNDFGMTASAIVAFEVTTDENGVEEKDTPYQVQ